MIEPISGDEIQRNMNSLRGPAFRIISEHSRRSDVSVEDLMSRNRKWSISHVRQDCMAAIRRELGYSYPQIAKIFGFDHTTVIHGVRRSDKRHADKSVMEVPL